MTKYNTAKTLGFFWKHVKKYKLIASIIVLCIFIGISASMVTPFLYKNFFNIMVGTGDKEVLYKSLITIIFYVLGINIVEWIVWRVSGALNTYFQPKIISNILNECFEYLHGHSYSFFNDNFTGALLKRVSRMGHAFENTCDRVSWDLIPLAIRVVGTLCVLFYLHYLLGLAMLVWVVVFIAIAYALSMYKLKFNIKKSEADTKVTAVLADTISNNINIKLFSGFNYEQARFGEATESWFRKTKKSFDIDVIIEAFQGAFMIAIDLLILYIAVILWRKNLLTVGDFVLIQAYLLEIFLQLWNFGRVIRSLYEHLANADEMTEILNKPYEVKDKMNAKMLDVSIGKIEFKNVNFSYDDGAEIMNDLSFEVKPGEKIALIGPSGGGKSTIVKLLLRLYNLKKGDIFIDGQNIADVTQDSLRQAIALVPQDPILFHRTLMDNIRYGKRNATEAEVIEAAKLAHAHEFVSKFKAGYESFVGERGIKLSGGERQRVAIARAILANPKILILDEATSQLDSESELFIKEALKVLMAGKTSFVIAHRLSTIMQMDRIFVIENGRIAEQGTHKTLLEKDGGIYKKLWDLQVNGFIKQIEEGEEECDENKSIITQKPEDLT
ncbi:MAG: hypothetical protein UT33_C0014G0013 [Candidatus Peregrinibacteria bacterium GW2011_GWC2_39_14]|nr:MAG: Multidrug resistance ABC transporter ATP binding protein [Candidatus Peregrinibacteria bacterium GW2011_GWA2_38_36]KKR05015.1 MAG: hypothetical protein UT33_C0014G0013 [Candidatus Peregrinibacteria bacterium GW2011_GWC2_39_14]